MADLTPDTRPADVGHLVERISQAARDLVKNHVELAKIELKEKASHLSRDAALIGAGALLGLIALVLLNVALAEAIGRTLNSLALGFLIVGGFWLVVGAALVFAGLAKLKREKAPPLTATADQLKLDKRIFAELRGGEA